MDQLDQWFAEAVAAIDSGDLPALRRLLTERPEIVGRRLESMEAYLLGFVAEDPVRTGRLPSNIVEIAQLIVEAARQHAPASLQSQLDETLRLVAWSGVAADCGVQLPPIDMLVREGATPEDNANNARWSTGMSTRPGV